MAQHTFFRYLRLKFLVTLIRLVVRWNAFVAIRRDLPLSQGIERQGIRIPSRDKRRYIDAWIYYPPDHPASSSPTTGTTKKPILVNWHGSGFVFPFLGTDQAFCARVARETGLLVLDADYRKAPETPFPGAVHDVEDALNWVASQPDRFDLARVAVSGFSAGGNLALVAASALRKKLLLTDMQIPIVVATYPVTNLSIAPQAKAVPNPRKPIPPGVAAIFDECYTPDPETRKDPRVSPSLADPADYPGTVVIITCEGDTLSPEAGALADALDDGTRKVVHRILKAVHHGFDKGVKKGTNEWERREEAYALAVKALKEALSL